MKFQGFLPCLILFSFTFLSTAQENKDIETSGKYPLFHFYGGLNPHFLDINNSKRYDYESKLVVAGIDAGLAVNKTGGYFSWYFGAGLFRIIDLKKDHYWFNNNLDERDLTTAKKILNVPDDYYDVKYYTSEILNYNKPGFSFTSGVKFYLLDYSLIWPNFYLGCGGDFFILPVKRKVYYNAYGNHFGTPGYIEFRESLTYKLTRKCFIPHIQFGCEFPVVGLKMMDCGLKIGYGTPKAFNFGFYSFVKF